VVDLKSSSLSNRYYVARLTLDLLSSGALRNFLQRGALRDHPIGAFSPILLTSFRRDRMNRYIVTIIGAVALVSAVSCAFAFPISGVLPEASFERVVAIDPDSVSTVAVASPKFNMKPRGRSFRLGVLDESATFYPILLAVKVGRSVVPVGRAISKGLCKRPGVVGYSVLRRSLKGAKFGVGTSEVGDSSTESFLYLKRFKRSKSQSVSAALRAVADKRNTVSINGDCSPLGNALSLGVGSIGESLGVRSSLKGDADNDGLPDSVDIDVDGDGILNPYDLSTPTLPRNFYLFSNLKVGIEQTVNVNTGVTPTREQVDALLSNASTLAIEVVADNSLGEVSELDCGGLSYCTTGGTGSVDQSRVPFPGPLGGSFDTDADGNGTIEKGSTNDFQLRTGAGLAEINAGDTFVQEVTDSSGRSANYFARLAFVFKGTPALKSLTVNSDSTRSTNFSYPIAEGGEGTPGNCINVSEDTAGDLRLSFEAWRPQRKGVPALGEGEWVDIGGSEITIDIPNKPCSSAACSVIRSPNNCGISSYSTSDPNLSVSTGRLMDGSGDVSSSSTNTLSFILDLKACLAESGDSLDVGEEVNLDLQFRSVSSQGGSDNAAVKFCIRRSS
jgi:hypothetical protein